MGSTENLVLFDWLSFTTKSYSEDEIKYILGLASLPWQLVKGARGYQDRWFYDSISIHFNGREDMGVWVEMSGQGCRAFETYSFYDWQYLFNFLNNIDFHITRLDVAYDDHSGVLDISQICYDTLKQNYVSRSDWWEVVQSSKGSSVFIGSPKSLIRFRIYDKARERNCEPGTHWIRVEMQLRDDRAGNFLKLFSNPLVGIGEAFFGVVYNYLKFVVPNESDSNKWRWELTDYWSNFLESLTPISIYTCPGVEYNMIHLDNFVFKQAGNAIDAAIEIYGVDKFIELLHKRQTQPNPKYQNLINQYKVV